MQKPTTPAVSGGKPAPSTKARAASTSARMPSRRQRAGVRHDLGEVVVGQDRVARPVEQVRRHRQPAGVGQPLAHVLDVLGDAERLLQHHHTPDGRDLGVGDRQRRLVSHAPKLPRRPRSLRAARRRPGRGGQQADDHEQHAEVELEGRHDQVAGRLHAVAVPGHGPVRQRQERRSRHRRASAGVERRRPIAHPPTSPPTSSTTGVRWASRASTSGDVRMVERLVEARGRRGRC